MSAPYHAATDRSGESAVRPRDPERAPRLVSDTATLVALGDRADLLRRAVAKYARGLRDRDVTPEHLVPLLRAFIRPQLPAERFVNEAPIFVSVGIRAFFAAD